MIMQNVLSFENTIFDFNDLTIVLGPNASGKSNFIKVLTFIKAIALQKQINSILIDDFHYSSLNEFFNNPNKPIFIQINFKCGRFDGHYNLTFKNNGRIVREELSYQGSNVYKEDRNDAQSRIFGYSNDNVGFNLIRDYLQSISCYSFISDKIRVIHPITGANELVTDGENVSQLLNNILLTDRDVFFKIENRIKEIFPFIERLNVTPTSVNRSPSVSLSLKERGIPQQIHYNNISDGTLRIIAFITALELKSSLITFEEPENCIHPSLFETLVDLFKKSDKQLVVTTHSPYLLRWVPVDSIRLFSRKNEITHVGKVVDKDTIQLLIQDGFSLGDLWFEGRLEKD